LAGVVHRTFKEVIRVPLDERVTQRCKALNSKGCFKITREGPLKFQLAFDPREFKCEQTDFDRALENLRRVSGWTVSAEFVSDSWQSGIVNLSVNDQIKGTGSLSSRVIRGLNHVADYLTANRKGGATE
jgi:hypothetical protein